MSLVLLEVKNAAGFITLNKPDKLNAFNRAMALDLQARLIECADNPMVRVIGITGAGKGFSAGQDLAEASELNGEGLKKILAEQFNPIIRMIRNMQKPVVAAVNGVAAGAGANIALSCDVVIASRSASFIQAFSKIGLIPDSGGTYTLPRLVGWQKASALMLLGDGVSAEEAERMGMIYKVFPEEDFQQAYLKIILILAQMPTRALALTKQALSYSITNNLEQQLNAEEELQSAAGATDDFAEGVRAFIEKRRPVFKGE